MSRLDCLALALMIAMLWGAAPAGAQSAGPNARHWRVIVIVPEQHLAAPRIPDPAVETALCRRLIDADYKVIDQDRYSDLRYSEQMDRVARGGPGADQEAARIGRKFGADLFVTGQAFTQEVSRQNVQTDLGNVTRIRCRARIELRAIRMDTAERVYVDSIQQTGPPDATVELSSKACLEEAADVMAPALLRKLDRLALGSTQSIDIQVRGMADIARAHALETAIRGLGGVLEVSPGNYEAHTWEAEVVLDKKAAADFAARLQEAPALRRFKLMVMSASGSRIVAVCR